ncbi:MAG: hypothetical protein AB7U45_08000 [Desulfamplus sp.]
MSNKTKTLVQDYESTTSFIMLMIQPFKISITHLILSIFLAVIIYPVQAAQASAILTMQSINCGGGSAAVQIPLTLQTHGENIAALHVDIHIDKNLFQITNVSAGTAAAAADKIIAGNQFDEDTYRIGVISTDSINNMTDGIIAYVNLLINDLSEPQIISLYVEYIIASNPTGNYIDIEPHNYIILTDNYPEFNIASGSHCIVFGSAGINTIKVESGANVECINFPGKNQINIEENSADCLIRRSGAAVYISGSNGTKIKLPASKTEQTLRFKDGSSSLVITNQDGIGKVMLGRQEVKTTETVIETPENTYDIFER